MALSIRPREGEVKDDDMCPNDGGEAGGTGHAQVIAPHVPLLCLFGCLCLFVLGLVPFWARVSLFFFFLFCGVCLSL